jgi:hypothetical protein
VVKQVTHCASLVSFKGCEVSNANESLRSKLATEEEFRRVLRNTTLLGYDRVRRDVAVTALRSEASYPHVAWWAAREKARMTEGIYETTETLSYLNLVNPWAFAHVSLEDKTMVAYTPDKASGEADRQVRLSIGKLVSKLCPLLVDHRVAELVEQHNAELTNEIFFMSGKDIAEFYAKDSVTGACMSAKAFVVQPALAYDAPNIRMAYLKDSSGRINARCMVYEPSETDKRYIRGYGSPVLVKRLVRAGYKCGTWEGARFKTLTQRSGEELKISEENKSECFDLVLPYLDSSGGMAGPGSTVALFDGVLTSIGADLTYKLTQRGTADRKTYTGSGSSTGKLTIYNFDTSTVNVTDFLTGQPLNTLMESHVTVYDPDTGQFGIASAVAVGGSDYCYRELRKDRQVSPMPEALPTLFYVDESKTFWHNGYRQVKSPETYEACGYLQLDPEVYPEETSGWQLNLVPTKKGFGMRKTDAVGTLETLDGELSYVPAATFKAKGWVKLHRESSEPQAYAKPHAVYLTHSGRKVHPKYNKNLGLTLLGYEFRRNCGNTRYSVFEKQYLNHKLLSLEEEGVLLNQELNREVDKLWESGNFVQELQKLTQDSQFILHNYAVFYDGRIVTLNKSGQLPVAAVKVLIDSALNQENFSADTVQLAILRRLRRHLSEALAEDCNLTEEVFKEIKPKLEAQDGTVTITIVNSQARHEEPQPA